MNASREVGTEAGTQTWSHAKEGARLVLLFLLLCLMLLSHERNSLWRDEISLWADAVARNPGSAKARNNLGVAYQAVDLDLALEQFLIAVEIDPRNSSSYSNICGISSVRLN